MSSAPPPDPPSTPPRKPAGLEWESYVDRRIREAEAAGDFDNLPGAGQPIPGIDDPRDDDWWVKRKLKDEGLSVVHPLLTANLARERLLERLPRITSELEVRQQLERLNGQIREAIASLEPAPPVVVLPVDVDEAVRAWRDSRQGGG
ncbi:MAG: DUF1992 domain-containing protein [Planctomyces sp.]|nr:DUF1992 domain-containing protein [Planctomyces sp.]